MRKGLLLLLLCVILASGGGLGEVHAQGPDPAETELVDLRTADSSTYDLGNGQRRTVFSPGLNLTFDRVGGRDLAVFDGLTVERAGNELSLTDGAGRGITWELPTSNISQIGRFLTYDDRGMSWSYRLIHGGVKFSGNVASPRGLQTYTFPYRSSSPLSIGRDGELEGDGFKVARPFVVDANGQVILLDWSMGLGVLSITFDDAGIALPYQIDPTTTFTPTAGGDDGQAQSAIAGYPPSCASVDTTATSITTRKGAVGGSSIVIVGLMEWDTSSIPDTAVINSADFKPYVSATVDDDARNYEGDWHTVATIDCSDYAVNVGSSAFSEDITGLSTSTRNTIALTDAASNINLTGNTGIRTGIDGGAPSVNNTVTIDSQEGTNAPQLTVDYTEMTVTAISPDEVAANDTESYTVTGTAFTGVIAGNLEKSGQPNINCTSVTVVLSTSVTMDCNMATAVGGDWDVRLSKAGGSEVGSALLDVNALDVAEVSPNTANATGPVTFTITGDGFDTGAQAVLIKSGESDITCTGESIASFVEMSADCDLTGVASGFWNMEVTNSPSSNSDTLNNAVVISSVITLLATGVSSGEHTLRIVSDVTGVFLYLDGNLEDSHGSYAIVADNANDYAMFTNNAMPYVEYVQLTPDGVLSLWYQFDDLPGYQLVDRSGEGNTTTARFPDTTSALTVSLGAMEATASSEISPEADPTVLGANPAQNNFSDPPTSSSGGFFLFDIMSNTADQGGLPYQFTVTVFILVVVIIGGVLVGRVFHSALPTGAFLVIGLVVAWGMGALPLWMAILFAIGPMFFFLIYKKVTA